MSSERAAVLALLAVNAIVLCMLERRRARPHLLPNLALTTLLLALNAGFERAATALGVAGTAGGGLLARLALPSWAQVLAVVVVLDGLAYAAHVLLHKVPAAWRFHRVHHSDAQVDVSTAFRQHPLETVWRHAFQAAGALALGASARATAVYLAASALNAQLEHADVRLPARLERALRWLFATPAMHRVHHSRAQVETDTNYSNIFSAWDRLFGTYRAPRAGEVIACGLDGLDGPAQQKTMGLLALPFRP